MTKFCILILLFSSLISRITTFPQAGPSKCEDGERLVPFAECQVDLGETVAVDKRQFAIPGLEDKEEEDNLCCLEINIIKNIVLDANNKTCSDFEGFQCVTANLCKTGILSPRGALDAVLQVVVNEDQVKQLQINPEESKCPRDLEVCCEVKAQNLDSIKTNTPTTIAPTPSPVVKTSPSTPHRCGRHNKNGIVIKVTKSNEGETATQFGEWPHMCIVYQKRNKPVLPNLFVGGASLIAPGIILTAAHKVYNLDPSELSVRCGEWDLNEAFEPKPYQDRNVRKMTIHPSFYSNTTLNNFALLHLSMDFVLSEHIDTICLPEDVGGGAQTNYDSNECVATGWGKDKHGKHGQYQTLLKQIKLSIVDRKTCQAKLRRTENISDSFILENSLICAGGDANKDTCKGDGGGPLVCLAKQSQLGEKFIQVGIVSWGLKCGTPDVPGVYASVEDGLCFIDWATKCVDGNKFTDFYNVKSCDNWIDQELDRLSRRIRLLERRDLPKLTEGQRLKTVNELDDTRGYLKKAEALKSSCGTVPRQDIAAVGERNEEVVDVRLAGDLITF